MKLPITPFSQRDVRWRSKKLGNGTGTISNYGCLLVCHTLLLNYYGKDFTVDSLNEFYKSHKAFDGNLINYFAAASCWEDIAADEYYNCYDDPCDLAKIDKYLEGKKPVIALVDFEPKAGIQTHFILIIGKNEAGSYICIDPWDGIELFFEARFGDPVKDILGLRLYSGPVPQENGDTVETLKAENKKLGEQYSEEIKLVAKLRGEISVIKQAQAGDEKELEELRDRNRKLEIEASSASSSIDKLTKELDSLTNDNIALKLNVAILKGQKVENMTTKQLVDLLIGRIFRRNA